MSKSSRYDCFSPWYRSVISCAETREPVHCRYPVWLPARARLGRKWFRRGRGFERDVLNCTVFNAATSHPSDCKLNTAILLPTYLGMDCQHSAARERSG